MLQPLAPLPLSSGDLIADRRFEWARAAIANGDFGGAADLLAQTLELVPDYAAAWFALGEARARLGDREGAVAAFEKARAADPADRHGAALQLKRLNATASDDMPAAYVRAVFDQYAPRFDHALTEGLSYRAPALLLDAVRASGVRMKFGTALDLGCGTGLGGAAFRPFCDWLVGVDLSGGMIAQARDKGLYDRLVEADIVAFLADEPARYHLIVAADVLMYFADLAPVLRAMAPRMKSGDVLAFTVETHDGSGVLLRDTLRYAHGADYVREISVATGLDLVSLESAVTRTEKGVPVPGLVAVARVKD